MRTLPCFSTLALLTACGPSATDTALPQVDAPWPYTVVDTMQTDCYDDSQVVSCPAPGEAFSGQDGQHQRYASSYDSDGETVVDNNTGLVWQWEQLDGVAWGDAQGYCEDLELGGITSWRVPTIKEAYSLMQFDGSTGSASPESSGAPSDALPYIDTLAFDFSYGDTDAGERYIDTQFITSSVYVSAAFADNEGRESGEACFFGTNLADGRIKCYPTSSAQSFQLRCVAGNEDYGYNDFEDQEDGSITDHATGLQWLTRDSGHYEAGTEGDGTLDWGEALAWCEELEAAGFDDWRLPDAKELQSIVDYGRSPDTTGSAAIDPLFDATQLTAEDGHANYGWYWTSTTHLDGMEPATNAVYLAFGEAMGYTRGVSTGEEMVLDVHGAGAQRSDPKSGAREDYPELGQGPQGDVRRVFNLARCVRDGE